MSAVQPHGVLDFWHGIYQKRQCNRKKNHLQSEELTAHSQATYSLLKKTEPFTFTALNTIAPLPNTISWEPEGPLTGVFEKSLGNWCARSPQPSKQRVILTRAEAETHRSEPHFLNPRQRFLPRMRAVSSDFVKCVNLRHTCSSGMGGVTGVIPKGSPRSATFPRLLIFHTDETHEQHWKAV